MHLATSSMFSAVAKELECGSRFRLEMKKMLSGPLYVLWDNFGIAASSLLKVPGVLSILFLHLCLIHTEFVLLSPQIMLNLGSCSQVLVYVKADVRY